MGERIATLRKGKGMTQEELSIRAGLQRTHVLRIEAGMYGVSLDVLAAIAEALDCRVDIIEKKNRKRMCVEGPKQITQKMLDEKLQDVSKHIPITESILKKNNFVRDGEYTASYGHYAGYGSGCPDEHYVTYRLQEGSLNVKVRYMNGHLHDIDICTSRYWMSSTKIKFVHELNTALTLCEAGMNIMEE
jgi:transcriptional regulator with XRE-family HTH domain